MNILLTYFKQLIRLQLFSKFIIKSKSLFLLFFVFTSFTIVNSAQFQNQLARNKNQNYRLSFSKNSGLNNIGTEIANYPKEGFKHNAKVEADSVVVQYPRIRNVYQTKTDEFKLIIDSEDEEVVDILIFNLLGKEVDKPFSSMLNLKNGPNEYTFNTSNLPQGHYFCILAGKNLRNAFKFVVSR